jgi:sugar (pentulose or hexulose) kinase
VAEVIAKVGGNTKVNVSEIWTTLNGLGATETNLKSNLSFSAKDGEGAGGSISNITDSNLSPGNLLKSAYDNMAENYFQYGTALGGDIGRVLCMGGISARCAPLRQSISKRFGLEVHTAPFGEDTLCGLARVALRVSGRCRDFAQTAALLEKLVIEPKTEG